MSDTKQTETYADLAQKRISRRTLLRLGGCAGISVVAGGVGVVAVDRQTDFFDRLRGVSHTPVLDDPAAWRYAGDTLTLALDRVPALASPGSAVQLDDDAVPEPLLIVHSADDAYYVYVNKCPHGKRKIDPHNGELECTSISQSTFDYGGTVLSGPADAPLTTYTVARDGDTLTITLA